MNTVNALIYALVVYFSMGTLGWTCIRIGLASIRELAYIEKWVYIFRRVSSGGLLIESWASIRAFTEILFLKKESSRVFHWVKQNKFEIKL